MRMFVGITDGEWFRMLAARLKRNSVPGTLSTALQIRVDGLTIDQSSSSQDLYWRI
jgi:hypothetical protein